MEQQPFYREEDGHTYWNTVDGWMAAHGLVVAVAETTMDSQEFHNALANLQNAVGVTDGGWASVYDWEEWDTYDSNTRCEIVAEYLESELRRTQEGA